MNSMGSPVFDPDITSIRAVFPTPRGGLIAMSGFPGLESDIGGTAYLDPERMEETLAGLMAVGAKQLLVLTEEAELPATAFTLLNEVADRMGLRLSFASIQDFSVPDAGFLKVWSELEARFLIALEQGETVALCCQYGAGRSGLTAAMLLMACGMSAGDAIPFVRQHFSEAIENATQENWLRGLSTG